jgi:hypothetical protein
MTNDQCSTTNTRALNVDNGATFALVADKPARRSSLDKPARRSSLEARHSSLVIRR